MYKINSLWYSSEPPNGFFSERLQEVVDVHYQNRYRWYVYNNIPRKRVMIDIGANIGIFARPSAERFEHVICFEPVFKNFEVFSVSMFRISSFWLSKSFAATRERIEKERRASITESVPSAESFRPVKGKVSGPRWH
jgi:hypothetical protein